MCGRGAGGPFFFLVSANEASPRSKAPLLPLHGLDRINTAL